MRRSIPLLFMLGSSLTFLASRYTTPATVSGASSSNWGPFGQIAGLCALALVALAFIATLNPGLKDLPLGATALGLGIFAVLSISAAIDKYPEVRTHLRPGAYLGLAAAGTACAAAAALRWRELTRRRSVVSATGQAVALALLVSCMVMKSVVRVPSWYRDPFRSIHFFPHGWREFLVFQPPLLVCLATYLVLVTWSRERQPGSRLASVAALAMSVVATYLLHLPPPSSWSNELRVLVAGTVALLVLSLTDVRDIRIGRPSFFEGAGAFAAVLLLVSLFLPWYRDCSGGVCASAQGWSYTDTDVAIPGALAALLLVGAVVRRRVYAELALGAALYVLVAERFVPFARPRLAPLGGHPGFVYGALLSFIAAGLLVLACVWNLRAIPPKRFLSRSVPIVACLALLSFPAAAKTYTVSTFARQSPWLDLAWFSAAAVLISLRLLLVWITRPAASGELVALPLGLLGLTVLDLIYLGTETSGNNGFAPSWYPGISWEGWVFGFLCALLAACGWIAWRGGYRAARTDGSASTTSLATSP